MAELEVEVEPIKAGFAPDRLERIDRHFARYVDDGRLAGWLLVVSRDGLAVHLASCGDRDREAGRPVEVDTLWRIYSMTKPITAVAAMMLYEEGAFELKDPVSRFIPSFADMRVYTAGSALAPVTVPAMEPIRIWHLLTHTAGLTYGFHHAHPVDAIYRAAGFEWGAPKESTWPVVAMRGLRCRCCSSRDRSGTTRSLPTCSVASWRSRRARPSTNSSGRASSSHSACPTPHSRSPSRNETDSRRCTCPIPAPGWPRGSTAWATSRCVLRPRCPAVAASCRAPPTTSGSRDAAP